MKMIKMDYEVKINFESGVTDPERLYLAAAKAMQIIKDTDNLLARTISSKFSATYSLQSIAEGSLRSFIESNIEFNQEELENTDPNDTDLNDRVKKYFSSSKRVIAQNLADIGKVENEEQVKDVADNIEKIAQETGVSTRTLYAKPKAGAIFKIAEEYPEIGENLRINESVEVFDNEEKYVLPSHIETRDTLFPHIDDVEPVIAEREIILKIKKPDYLGDSMWEMKHGKNTIKCKIMDNEWLGKFKSKEVLAFPGDSLDCDIRMEEKYDKSGNLEKSTFEIIKVRKVIQGED